jgi:hypothetical protein
MVTTPLTHMNTFHVQLIVVHLIGITCILNYSYVRHKILMVEANKCRILFTLKIVFLQNVGTYLPNYSKVPEVL